MGKRNTLPEVKVPVPVCSLTDLPRSNSPMASPPLPSTNLGHHSLSVGTSDTTIDKVTLQLTDISKQLEYLTAAISNQACTMKLKSDVNFNAMELVKVKNNMNKIKKN